MKKQEKRNGTNRTNEINLRFWILNRVFDFVIVKIIVLFCNKIEKKYTEKIELVSQSYEIQLFIFLRIESSFVLRGLCLSLCSSLVWISQLFYPFLHHRHVVFCALFDFIFVCVNQWIKNKTEFCRTFAWIVYIDYSACVTEKEIKKKKWKCKAAVADVLNRDA